MSKGIQGLRRDHELILTALDALVALARLAAGGAAPRAQLAGLLTFFREFADAYHHAKEEAVLFPALEAAGFPRHGGPVAVMLHEHDQGRELLRRIDGLLGETPARDGELLEAALAYHALLSQHIYKENNILFVLAEERLDPSDLELEAGFARVEAEQMPPDRRLELERLVAEAARGPSPAAQPCAPRA